MRDEPNMSDAMLLLTVEDLINIAAGPLDINRVNFKVLQKVLHILASQMRVLEQKVEIRDGDLKKTSSKDLSALSKGASVTLQEPSQEGSLTKKEHSDKTLRSRSASLEVVTREQFVTVRDKVRALLDRAGIQYDVSAFDDRRKRKETVSVESVSPSLRSDATSAQSGSKATLVEILTVEQLTARMGAVEKVIEAMTEILAKLEAEEGEDDGIGMPCPGDPLVTKPLMEQALKRLRDELSRAVTDMGLGISSATDEALKIAKGLRTRVEGLSGIDQHINELHSLVQEYAQQLSGFDDGLTAQISNFQEQLKQTREDLESGIKRLELACTNAEKAALVELKGKYEELQVDQEILISKHGELTVSRKRLEEDVMSIVQCVENLREQKADRDEVLDGLRDKVNISQLSGLLSEEKLEKTKEELAKRLELCYEKFSKQDSAWRELLKNLTNEMRSKAGATEVLNVQERARSGLQELYDLVRRLSAAVGEPKAAVLTRRIAKDAYCGVCMAPAHMPVQNEPQASSYPPLRAKPMHVEGKGDGFEDALLTAPEPRTHVCHRWCGGSHTVIGRPPTLTRSSAHYIVEMQPQQGLDVDDVLQVSGGDVQASAAERLARAGTAAANLVAAYSDPRCPNVAAGTRALRALAQLVSAIVNDVKGCSACYPEEERNRRLRLADALCGATDVLCRAAGTGDLEKINASSLVFGDAYSKLLYSLDRDKAETVRASVPEGAEPGSCRCETDLNVPST